MEYCVIFVTCSNLEEAEKISTLLLDRRLVACANVVEGVRSLFCWDGKREDAKETLVILKTRQALFKDVERAVCSAHSYAVAEIIALPIVEGSRAYLKWIDEQTTGNG